MEVRLKKRKQLSTLRSTCQGSSEVWFGMSSTFPLSVCGTHGSRPPLFGPWLLRNPLVSAIGVLWEVWPFRASKANLPSNPLEDISSLPPFGVLAGACNLPRVVSDNLSLIGIWAAGKFK